MDTSALAILLLRVDAIANAALAVLVLALVSPLGAAAGLDGWVLAVLAGALLVNGALCWQVAARPGSRPLRALAEVDLLFAATVAGFALLDPTMVASWLRAVLGGMALLVAAVAVTKLLLARRLAPLVLPPEAG